MIQSTVYAILIAMLVSASALANEFIQLERESILVCAVTDLDAPPPVRDSPHCTAGGLEAMDPHQRTIWILGRIAPRPALLSSDRPIGFYVSAKAASRVVLNGQELGATGVPGVDRAAETPGRIDAVFAVDRDLLNPDGDEVAILMSGHHSLIASSRPVLILGVFEYLEPPHHERATHWASFATLGVFVVAGLYAGMVAGFRLAPLAAAPLAVTCVLAAAQVIAETLRSVWSYPYPVHDLRLAAITLCGLGVGLALAAHVLIRLNAPRKALTLAGIALVTLAAVMTAEGFDATASRAILIPNLFAGLIALWQARTGERTAALYAGGFFAFVALNLFDPGEFLDRYYFLALSALVLFLTVLQAAAYRTAVLDQANARRVRRRLEQALERAAGPAPQRLTLRHSGKVDAVDVSSIASLQAAGDYVVIRLLDGRELVATASLAALEKELPEHFLRVHRSYTVNAQHIASLKRHAARTGTLTLTNGQTLPVSRRVMPRLRKALVEGSRSAGARA